MLKRAEWSVAGLAGLVLGGVGGWALAGGLAGPEADTATAVAAQAWSDGRTVIALTAEDRAHISGEMRGFLQGLTAIGEATLMDDRETIREVAASLSRGQGGGAGVRDKVPDGFRAISQQLRQGFTAIEARAMEAEMAEIQQSLIEITYSCNACHGSYRVQEIRD